MKRLLGQLAVVLSEWDVWVGLDIVRDRPIFTKCVQLEFLRELLPIFIVLEPLVDNGQVALAGQALLAEQVLARAVLIYAFVVDAPPASHFLRFHLPVRSFCSETLNLLLDVRQGVTVPEDSITSMNSWSPLQDMAWVAIHLELICQYIFLVVEQEAKQSFRHGLVDFDLLLLTE